MSAVSRLLTEARGKARDEGQWHVRLNRRTAGSQVTYHTKNPQGGGFGTNTSNPSFRRAEAQATRNIPSGTSYHLTINDKYQGVKTKA